jgi:hypothetical protein
VSVPEIETPNSAAGRDADDYQWAEFNLPADLKTDHAAAPAEVAVALAPAPDAA